MSGGVEQLRERARLWGWQGGLPELLDEIKQFLAENGGALPNAPRTIITDEQHREAAIAITVGDLGRLRTLPGLRNLFEPIPDLARGWREMYPYGLAALDAAARAARFPWVRPEHVENWLKLALAVYARTGYSSRPLLERLGTRGVPAINTFLLHCCGYTGSAIEALNSKIMGEENKAVEELQKLPIHDDWRKDITPVHRQIMLKYQIDTLNTTRTLVMVKVTNYGS